MSSLYKVFFDGYGLLHVSSHALETLVWTVRLSGARGFTGEKGCLREGLSPEIYFALMFRLTTSSRLLSEGRLASNA